MLAKREEELLQRYNARKFIRKLILITMKRLLVSMIP